MKLTPLEWELRAPITPRLGGNCWALPRLGESEPNEEKQTDSKHKTSDTSEHGFPVERLWSCA